MKEQITVSRNFKIITFFLITIGVVSFIFGLLTDHKLTWAHYLIVNYTFFHLQWEEPSFLLFRKFRSQAGLQLFREFPKQ